MFIHVYLTIFVILFYYQTYRVGNVVGDDASDNGWGLFLSVSQGNDEYPPSYDIGHWTRQLHLQQCAFVEIGEEFCALFVELRNIPSVAKIPDSSGVGEFFLGLCECATVRSWILCSDQLMRHRKSDCIFTEAVPTTNTSARVHRRLCDVTLLTSYAQPCNCSIPMANQQLHRTQGFPTCFRSPLPESICYPRGVCGIARCCATTIKGIHSPRCDPECHEKQPFCEELGPWTSVPPEITSLWSHWSTPVCENNGGRVFSTATAICLNQFTGKPAIDCIGPGSFCCPPDMERCTCIVTNENGILKATRIIESKPCLLDFERDRASYSKEDHSEQNENDIERYDDASDLFYRDASQERMEHRSPSEYENGKHPWRRRLMFSSYGYSEDRNRYFDKRAEFGRAQNVLVNEDEGDDKGDDSSNDNRDEKEGDDKSEEKSDEKQDDSGDNKDDDESDDNVDDNSDGDGDNDDDDDIVVEGGDENADEDANKDDDGELSDDEEDNAESSDYSDYVERNRDQSMENSELKWTDESSSRFVRSNRRMGGYLRKGKDKRGLLNGTDDECEEKDSTNIEGPPIYFDYDGDSSDSEDDKETSGEDYDAEASSLAIIGRVLTPCPYYCLSIYVCIASMYLI